MSRPLRRLLLLSMMAISLVGCSRSDPMNELKTYVKEIKQRKAGDIVPLPEFKPYKAFKYAATEIRSPFVPSEIKETVIDIVEEDNGIKPDLNRAREALETYALDSLKMLGSLKHGEDMWAIIVDPDGNVHRVTRGNYMGLHFGKITDITEERVKLTEIIADDIQGWEERNGAVVLEE